MQSSNVCMHVLTACSVLQREHCTHRYHDGKPHDRKLLHQQHNDPTDWASAPAPSKDAASSDADSPSPASAHSHKHNKTATDSPCQPTTTTTALALMGPCPCARATKHMLPCRITATTRQPQTPLSKALRLPTMAATQPHPRLPSSIVPASLTNTTCSASRTTAPPTMPARLLMLPMQMHQLPTTRTVLTVRMRR